ncbi:MAG: ABC transporter permease [Oscillospiraceae bacterium]|nr:ABC transporter permease [Oscillospiraceae bacterium]
MTHTEAAPASGAKKRTKKRSLFASMVYRFKKNKMAMFGLCLLMALVFLCAGASLFADYQEDAITQDVYNKYAAPSAEHIFGTDQYGRDIFARIIFGGRISLSVGVITVAMAMGVGIIIGSVAGYFGGWVDNVLMRIMDVFLAIPHLLMAVTIVAILGPSLINLLISMCVSSVPRCSRIVRSSILSVRGNEYVEAAQACGTSTVRIIARHIIPNAIGPIIVQASLNVAQTILTVASMSFIGLGIQSPQPEWGTMLSEGKSVMRYAPHLVIIPGIAIIIAVMAINLIGDGLRDAFDPKMKN